MSLHDKFKSSNSIQVQQATMTRAEYNQYCQLELDLLEAVETLREARVLVADWGEYASEYFQKKHDLKGDIDSLEAVIVKLIGKTIEQQRQSPGSEWVPADSPQKPLDGELVLTLAPGWTSTGYVVSEWKADQGFTYDAQMKNRFTGSVQAWLSFPPPGTAASKTLNMIPCKTPEDIAIKGTEVLIWDGCEFHVDYVECDPETGNFYMANLSEPTHWRELVPPVSSLEVDE